METDDCRMAFISTAHVARALAEDGEGHTVNGSPKPCFMERVAYMSNEYGWLFYTGNSDHRKTYAKERPGDIAWESFLQVLDDILWHYQKRGYRYLMFDVDGPRVPNFPFYDW